MRILAIETSCDESACSVVEDGQKVLSNVIASQIDIHALTGGVVPEVAAREHLVHTLPVVYQALNDADCDWSGIDAIAVTKGPGLVSSLIIGTETASTIAYVEDKPLIPVNHIVGHLYSNWLGRGKNEIQFPVLVLTVSGGHNELVLMRGHGDFEVLGATLDDAAGEAFDKVARILGLGYPGGPVISKLAADGDKAAFNFPRVYLEKGSLDFSFSGLKTAVINTVKNFANENGIENIGELSEEFKSNVAASFQESVVEVLADKILIALEKFPEVGEVHLAGGVSANLRLRHKIKEKLPSTIQFRYPEDLTFCTDNAAMIAAAAYFLYNVEPEGFNKIRNVVPRSDLTFL